MAARQANTSSVGQARQTESGPTLRCGSEHARLHRLWPICGEVVRPVADEPTTEYSSSLNPAERPQVGAASSHPLSSRPPSDPDGEPPIFFAALG
jgi:hypothetical protein